MWVTDSKGKEIKASIKTDCNSLRVQVLFGCVIQTRFKYNANSYTKLTITSDTNIVCLTLK